MANVRINQLPEDLAPISTDVVAVDSSLGGTTRKVPLPNLADQINPVASEPEAIAGENNTKRMTALRVAQAIVAQAVYLLDNIGQAQSLKTTATLNDLAALTGNYRQTFASIASQMNTAQPLKREVAAAFGLVSDMGAGVAPENQPWGDGDKIALYAGIEAEEGSFNSFASNFLTWLKPGNTSNKGAWITEFDLNVWNQHHGEVEGPSGLAQPIAWGINLTGASKFRATAAIAITGLGSNDGGLDGLLPTGDQWNRGIIIANTVQADIESYSSSAVFLRDWGNHDFGLDLMRAGYTGGAIRLANTHAIVVHKADASGDVPAFYIDPSGILHLDGETAVSLDKNTQVFGRLNSKFGTNGDSTGQPAGTWASTIYQATNTAAYNGLLAKVNWATADATIFEAGLDLVGGAYVPAFRVTGDLAVWLWDGLSMQKIKIGSAGSGPGGSGRALYLD